MPTRKFSTQSLAFVTRRSEDEERGGAKRNEEEREGARRTPLTWQSETHETQRETHGTCTRESKTRGELHMGPALLVVSCTCSSSTMLDGGSSYVGPEGAAGSWRRGESNRENTHLQLCACRVGAVTREPSSEAGYIVSIVEVG